jgi:hypothetical protein
MVPDGDRRVIRATISPAQERGAMRNRTGVSMAGLLLFAVGLSGPAIGQQQVEPEESPRDRGVQVSVPQTNIVPPEGGRQGGRGQDGQARGRASGAGANAPARPAPRTADGRIVIGGTGVWLPGPGLLGPFETLPMQPWALGVRQDRELHELEPHTRCKPSGVARQFITPYGVEIVDLPEIQRVYIFDIGGPHTYRTVYMDGRTHPRNLEPSFYGHSIGWWEGDTLVVDTVGFNEGFWMDRGGLPHTDRLHTIERLTRLDYNSLRYELTVDDPGAYTQPWTRSMVLRWSDGVELFEYICQQQNYAPTLMLGQHEKVDRSSPIVP